MRPWAVALLALAAYNAGRDDWRAVAGVLAVWAAVALARRQRASWRRRRRRRAWSGPGPVVLAPEPSKSDEWAAGFDWAD